MNTFTPYEGMTFRHPTLPYDYEILYIQDDTLKCLWTDVLSGNSGYCTMSVSYAEKLQNLCI